MAESKGKGRRCWLTSKTGASSTYVHRTHATGHFPAAQEAYEQRAEEEGRIIKESHESMFLRKKGVQ